MFQRNDTVMYGNTGVCRIVDIRPEKFADRELVYYILQPVYSESETIYCPVDGDKVKIRKLLSVQEIHELIGLMPDTQTEWIENDQLRKEKYTEILRNGDHKELVKLIKTLHVHREEKSREGKKFHLADEKISNEAEKILHGEFAHVLHIQPDEVVPFIMGQLNHPEVEDPLNRQ